MSDATREAFELACPKTEDRDGGSVVYYTDDEYEEVAWPVWKAAVKHSQQRIAELESAFAKMKKLADLAEQRGRDALMKELSEQDPVATSYVGKHGGHVREPNGLMRRPSEPIAATKENES